MGAASALLILLALPLLARAELDWSEPDVNERLILSAEMNSVERLQFTLDEGADVNYRGVLHGKTAIMAASLFGAAKAVEFLLGVPGIDPMIPEKDGYTPMHGAGFQGRADVIRVLHKGGLDLSHRHADDGYTPIHRACFGPEPKHLEAVKTLIELGVDPNEPCNRETPIDTAMRVSNTNVIEYLKSVGGMTYKEWKELQKEKKKAEKKGTQKSKVEEKSEL